MPDPVLSVIIPARNEAYLEPTIKSILDNAEGGIEVIVILDGYLPDPAIDMKDNRVIFHAFEKAIGQRASINFGAKVAKGKYIMKLDAHCAVGKGFDVILARDCEYDVTMIPRMYNLDINTFTPKLHKRTDYMYISCEEGRLLRAEYYKRQPDNDKPIDDTMCCMGPGWFMHKARFWELGGMDELHGSWGQMGVELACKAWLSGGSMKVNKNTWFAHWFRGGGGPGFPYPISGRDQERARQYSRDIWLNNKWPLQVRQFQWMIDKFNPPGWETRDDMKRNEMELHYDSLMFDHVFDKQKKRYPRWKGHKVIKFPTDIMLYHQVIWDNKPDVIIECGTAYGGSTLFFADMLDLTNKGRIISIDIGAQEQPEHPRITYITGRTTAADTLETVKGMLKDGESVMVILDSDHRRSHVKRELYYYAPLVTPGQFLVVEDAFYKAKKKGPGEAIDWFLPTRRGRTFNKEDIDKQFVTGLTRGGWLRKI